MYDILAIEAICVNILVSIWYKMKIKQYKTLSVNFILTVYKYYELTRLKDMFNIEIGLETNKGNSIIPYYL